MAESGNADRDGGLYRRLGRCGQPLLCVGSIEWRHMLCWLPNAASQSRCGVYCTQLALLRRISDMIASEARAPAMIATTRWACGFPFCGVESSSGLQLARVFCRVAIIAALGRNPSQPRRNPTGRAGPGVRGVE